MRGTADEKCKIMKMLMGMQKSNNTNVEDISERLRDVCLNDTDGLWDKLTKDEQATFLRNLQSGNFSFISDWQPWWDVKRCDVIDIFINLALEYIVFFFKVLFDVLFIRMVLYL